MSKHTKEPWVFIHPEHRDASEPKPKIAQAKRVVGLTSVVLDMNDGSLSEDDAARIAECVNALAGIKSPSAIKGVIEAAWSYFENEDINISDWEKSLLQALTDLKGE